MLRERTLLHLLLSVARSLAEVPENSKYRDLLHDSCETLKITRDRSRPYVISILNENVQISKNVETSDFRFYERGDVAAQVQKRNDLPDARTYNWEQATKLWREILGVNLKKSQGLAPARSERNQVKRLEVTCLVLISLLLLLLEFWFNQSWPICLVIAWTVPLTRPRTVHLWIALCTIIFNWLISGFENPVLALTFIWVSLHLEHLDKSRLAVIWPFVPCAFLMALLPGQLPLLLIILTFEIIVSLAQINFRRLFVQVVSLFIVIAHLLLNDSAQFSSNLYGLITIPFALVLIILVFPYSSESNLIRVTAPLTLSIATIYFGFDLSSAAIFLIVWLFGFIKIAGSDLPVQNVFETMGIPVTLRRRDSAS